MLTRSAMPVSAGTGAGLLQRPARSRRSAPPRPPAARPTRSPAHRREPSRLPRAAGGRRARGRPRGRSAARRRAARSPSPTVIRRRLGDRLLGARFLEVAQQRVEQDDREDRQRLVGKPVAVLEEPDGDGDGRRRRSAAGPAGFRTGRGTCATPEPAAPDRARCARRSRVAQALRPASSPRAGSTCRATQTSRVARAWASATTVGTRSVIGVGTSAHCPAAHGDDADPDQGHDRRRRQRAAETEEATATRRGPAVAARRLLSA